MDNKLRIYRLDHEAAKSEKLIFYSLKKFLDSYSGDKNELVSYFD